MKASVAVLAGDGVGPEVIAEAVRCLEKVAAVFGHEFAIVGKSLTVTPRKPRAIRPRSVMV